MRLLSLSLSFSEGFLEHESNKLDGYLGKKGPMRYVAADVILRTSHWSKWVSAGTVVAERVAAVSGEQTDGLHRWRDPAPSCECSPTRV